MSQHIKTHLENLHVQVCLGMSVFISTIDAMPTSVCRNFLTRLYTPLTPLARPFLRLTTATPLTRLLLWRAGLSGDVSVRVDDMGSPMRRNFRAKTAVGGVCGRVGGAPALERHALLSQQICLPRRRLSRIR